MVDVIGNKVESDNVYGEAIAELIRMANNNEHFILMFAAPGGTDVLTTLPPQDRIAIFETVLEGHRRAIN